MGYSSYTERLKNLKKELDERAAAKRQRQLNANRSECASEFIFVYLHQTTALGSFRLIARCLDPTSKYVPRFQSSDFCL